MVKWWVAVRCWVEVSSPKLPGYRWTLFSLQLVADNIFYYTKSALIKTIEAQTNKQLDEKTQMENKQLCLSFSREACMLPEICTVKDGCTYAPLIR